MMENESLFIVDDSPDARLENARQRWQRAEHEQPFP